MRTETDQVWPAPVGAAVVLVLFGSLGLVAAGGWTWYARFLESSAPSWLQAVGSVGALFGVWATIRHQVLHGRFVRELEASERDLAAAWACKSTAEDAERMLVGIHRKISNANARIGPERIEEVLVTLRSIESRDLRPELMECTLVLKREVAYTLTAIHRHNEAEDVPEYRVDGARKRLDRVASVRRQLDRICSTYEERHREASIRASK